MPVDIFVIKSSLKYEYLLFIFFLEQIAPLLITIKVLDYFAYSTCKAEENPFPVIGKIVNWLRK